MRARTLVVMVIAITLASLAACNGGGGKHTLSTSFTVGGSVSGLGGTLSLQNNGGNDLSVNSNGDFTFSSNLSDGAAYSVTLAAQPSGQSCTVSNGTGTVSGADVTSVTVNCTTNPPGAPVAPVISAVTYGVKSVILNWGAAAGADHYKVLKNPDGASGYSQIGSDTTATTYTDIVPVHLADWLNARYMIAACSALDECAYSNDIIGFEPEQAIGYFKASNTESVDQFGWSVALSSDGNTMAIGAYAEDSAATLIDGDETDNSASDAGAIYIFTRSGNTWSKQAYIKASNTDAVDHFGWSVALSSDGNTLAVGADSENSAANTIDGDETDNSASSAGAVYIFARSGNTWSKQAYVKASNAGAGDHFGSSVALSSDGDTLAVGAIGEDSGANVIGGNQTSNTASDAGAVYVFTRAGITWSQEAYIKASNTGAVDQFGGSVALASDGDTLAVGAVGEDSGDIASESNDMASEAGAVYVFTRAGITWSKQAYIKASNSVAGNRFGTSVALTSDGNTLAVGAPGENGAATGIDGNQTNDSAGDAGAVYVFARAAGAWSQQTYVKASNTGANDLFGQSVALSPDGAILAVGATGENGAGTGIDGDQSDNAAGDAGAVYVFTSTGSTWSQQTYVKATNTNANDSFGQSLALSNDGTTLAVGAQLENGAATGINGADDNLAADAGAVYVY